VAVEGVILRLIQVGKSSIPRSMMVMLIGFREGRYITRGGS